MLNLPDIPKMLKALAWLIVGLTGGWIAFLLVAGYGCALSASDNKGVDLSESEIKGIDLSKDQSTSTETPVNFSGDATGSVTVYNVAGNAGWALLVPLALLAWRNRTAIKLVDRMASAIEHCENTRQVKATTEKFADAAERLLRKRLERL